MKRKNRLLVAAKLTVLQGWRRGVLSSLDADEIKGQQPGTVGDTSLLIYTASHGSDLDRVGVLSDLLPWI